MAIVLGAIVAAIVVQDPASVPRWGQYEINWSDVDLGDLPQSDPNPFLVELNVTFSLATSTPSAPAVAKQQPSKAPLLPPPLIAFDFEAGNDDSTPNKGMSNQSFPSASLVAAARSPDVPVGASGMSIDFGSDTTARHVVQIGNPFKALVGLKKFTITGWLRVQGSDMGDGGDRVINFCDGGPGFDLVWVSGGQLKLSINEWPDGIHPQSSSGTVPSGATTWPEWVFFAVSYDGTLPKRNVQWYFGNSLNAAQLDTNATNGDYQRGAVGDPNLALAFGNFGPAFHANDRLLRGKMFRPRIYDFVLSGDQVVESQQRSKCRPVCDGRSCGSDGCGGACGECSPARVCSASGMCELPTTLMVGGFYDGSNTYRARFSPPYEGTWKWTSSSSLPQLNGKSGVVVATPPAQDARSPVESHGYGLFYADKTPHFSVGTTCYQWSSKGFPMQAETLQTLREGPDGNGPVFNKIRMTVFPKWYSYNHANPVETGTPYEIIPGSVAANQTAWNCVGSDCPSTAGSFDLRRFNVSYWQNYERLVRSLQDMNIIADVIVFHPYDNGHWGFDCMGGRDPAAYNTTNDKFYLRYLAARLGSFSNVWWAMANEWSFCACKARGINSTNLQSPSPVWDDLFEALSSYDPYGRQTSIHNGNLLYNHSRPWITHVSLQGLEDNTAAIRETYGKPVIWDEVKYEGDVPESWGALSGAEETDRFWWGLSLGVNVGHSETMLRPNVTDDDEQPLWWAKGGTLIGQSPARIRWLRSQWQTNFSSTFGTMPTLASVTPTTASFGNSNGPVAQVLTSPTFVFLHFIRPGQWLVPLPATACNWVVKEVDYWAMHTSDGPKIVPNSDSVLLDVPDIPFNVAIGCSV